MTMNPKGLFGTSVVAPQRWDDLVEAEIYRRCNLCKNTGRELNE